MKSSYLIPLLSTIFFILLLQSTIVSTSFQRDNRTGNASVSEVVPPTLLTDFSRGKSFVSDLVINQDALFVADGPGGLRAFNVTNNSLELISVISNYFIQLVYLNDSLLFAKSTSYLQVIDVSDINNPVFLSEYPMVEESRDVAISGTTLYLVGYQGLMILNVSDPASPSVLSKSDTDGSPFQGSVPTSVVSNDSILYVGTFTYGSANNGIFAFNVSDPSSPQLLSYFSLSRPEGLAISGKYLFVAGSTDGFYAIDYSDPSNPIQVGNINLQADSSFVLIDGDYAYVSNSYGGLSVLDISIPFSMVEIARVSGDRFTKLAKRGNVLFVAREVLGVQAIDTSIPSSPVVVFSEDFPTDYFQSAFYLDSKLFVANDREGMLILSVKDPLNITQLGQLDVDAYVSDVKMRNNIAMIRERFGITFANVSDPEMPEVLSALQTAPTVDIEFLSNNSVIIAHQNGVTAYNISDPFSPKEMWSNDSLRNARVAEHNRTLTVINDTTAVFYDISNVSSPVEYGYLVSESGGFNDITLVGNNAYIIQDNWLLSIDTLNSKFSLISNTSIGVIGSIIESKNDLIYLLQHNRFSIYNVSVQALPELVGAIEWYAESRGFAIGENGTVMYLPHNSGISLLRYPPIPGWVPPGVSTDLSPSSSLTSSSSSPTSDDNLKESDSSSQPSDLGSEQKGNNLSPLNIEVDSILTGLGMIMVIITISRSKK